MALATWPLPPWEILSSTFFEFKIFGFIGLLQLITFLFFSKLIKQRVIPFALRNTWTKSTNEIPLLVNRPCLGSCVLAIPHNLQTLINQWLINLLYRAEKRTIGYTRKGTSVWEELAS